LRPCPLPLDNGRRAVVELNGPAPVRLRPILFLLHWSCFFAPWNAGACVFIFNCARFNAKALLDVLQEFEVTTLCAPPTVWRMLIQEDLAARRGTLKLRELIGAGEPLNPEVIEQVRAAWGLTIRDGFGQTETTAQIGNPPGQEVRPGSWAARFQAMLPCWSTTQAARLMREKSRSGWILGPWG